MNRLKLWFSNTWAKIKAWIYGLLVAIGLISTSVVMASATFTITMPTEYEPDAQGVIAPLPLSEISEVRLYCDGDPAPAWSMGTPTQLIFEFTAILGYGSHDCHATVIGTHGRESGPSNTVTKDVAPTTNPGAPGLE